MPETKGTTTTGATRRPVRSIINISGTGTPRTDESIAVRFTLTEQNGREIYTRTYDCTIDEADHVEYPNDLTSRIQTLCRAICLCVKYPNTYEGDS